jgi:hypothetical protein
LGIAHHIDNGCCALVCMPAVLEMSPATFPPCAAGLETAFNAQTLRGTVPLAPRRPPRST